jgi:2-dehydro-3-deoxyphosphogalactonate aldolase
MSSLPLVAILRGITPDTVLDYAEVIIEAGWSYIEVPLNSPNPFTSIQNLVHAYGDKAFVGAGTVKNLSEVSHLADIGGKLLVSPNTNPEVISEGVKRGLIVMPGFMTPTEAFAACHAGAEYLKLFPANSLPLTHIKSLKAVLPENIKIAAVGGVSLDNLQEFSRAGADLFGIASELYKPTMTVQDVKTRAHAFADAARNLKAR